MKKNKIIKLYKYLMKNSEEYLKRILNQSLVDNKDVYAEFCTFAEYKLEEIVPEIVDLSKSTFRDKYYLIICCMAFDYALTRIEETASRKDTIICAILDENLKKLPEWKKKRLGKQLMCKKKRAEYKAEAKKAEDNKIGKLDYRITYKEEKQERNKFKIRVFECGALKMAREIGLDTENVFPCVCRLDYLIAKHLGYKLERAGTLADENECCDFDFEYPGKTEFDLENINKEK